MKTGVIFAKKSLRKKNAIIYLDPPYYYKAEQLYGHIFSDQDHAKLRDYLVSIKCPWILSYDYAKEVRDLYDNQRLQARVVDNTYSAHPLGGHSFIGRELLYSNMDRLPPPDNSDHHVGITVRDRDHSDEGGDLDALMRIPLSFDANRRAYR